MSTFPRPAKMFRYLRDRLLQIGDFPTLEVVPLLTVLMLLTTAPKAWYLNKTMMVVCVAGLLFNGLRARTQYWYTVAAMIGATIYLNWEATDNHKYMLCYWCLALCSTFSLPVAVRDEALARSSRLLIGLCMALAVFWKALNPGYLSGAFFQYELLLDQRFEYFARWMTGITPTMLLDNRELEDLLKYGYQRLANTNQVVLSSVPGIATAATFLTWWTILIEGVLALAFLLPNTKFTSKFRNTLLLGFAATTYIFATVRGFGWMLMLLGLSQCKREERGFRTGYVAVFLLIQLYTLPIQPALDHLGKQLLPHSVCCLDTNTAADPSAAVEPNAVAPAPAN